MCHLKTKLVLNSQMLKPNPNLSNFSDGDDAPLINFAPASTAAKKRPRQKNKAKKAKNNYDLSWTSAEPGMP